MSTDDLKIKHNIQHDIHGVLEVVGYSTKFWTAVKKHSVSGTIPVVAFNTLAQFSLAYFAAIMITSNDLSFMQNIKFFYLYLPSSYTFIAIALLVTAAASLTIGYVCRQEIKDEKKIDEEIRGGHSDGINEIPQNASTIEIIPDLGNKNKKVFSIIVPISGKQGITLTNQREENRNQIIFLAVPYIISGLMIAGALAGFGFSNINGWVEISIISLAVIIAIVGTLVTLNNLKNNKVNQQLNIVTKPGNSNCIPLLNVFIPFSNSGVAYVMENEVEGEKGNEWYELADKHLTNLVDRICNLFDHKLLEPANGNIEKTLNGIEALIDSTLDKLGKDIEEDADIVKDVSSKAIADFFKELKGELGIKIKQLVPGRIGSLFLKFSEMPPSGDNHKEKDVFHDAQDWQTLITEDLKANLIKELKITLKKEIMQELQNSVREISNKADASPTYSCQTKEEWLNERKEKLQKENKGLRLEQEIGRLTEDNARLEKENAEKKETNEKQKETDEWQKKINGSPQEFLHYLLDYIKLKVGEDETSLRDFDNKIIINWKDGSQTTCYINKQDRSKTEPVTNVNFVNSNIQAAYKHVFPSQKAAPAA